MLRTNILKAFQEAGIEKEAGEVSPVETEL